MSEYMLSDEEERLFNSVMDDQDDEDIADIVAHAAIYAVAVESGMSDEEAEYLAHYGTPHEGNIPHSGRYAYGTGENPYRGLVKFQKTVKKLKDAGMNEKQIYKHLGFRSSNEFRARQAVAKMELHKYYVNRCRVLKDKGMSNRAIAKRLFGNEKKDTTVRNYLNEAMAYRNSVLESTMSAIKKEIAKNHYVDVGKGTELYLGVTKQRLKTAIEALKQEGYKSMGIRVQQLGTSGGEMTTVEVITDDSRPFKTVYADLCKHKDKIKPCMAYGETNDRGEFKVHNVEPPVSISSKRCMVKYAEDDTGDGFKGIDKDGVIEIRRGVKDLDLGKAHYAQVRIAVDGTHYIKGMCVYRDDMPPGVDIIFNTNKHRGTPMLGTDKMNTVFKPMEKDPNNPFGATIRDDSQLRMVQRHYIDKDGKEKLSALNIVNEEGNWREWSRTISAQMLSKQPPEVAKKQLDLTYEEKRREFEEIKAITNPTLRKIELEEFAEGLDAAAVHLKAHGFSRQMTQVILPINSLRDNEIYAPNFNNGEEVVLIRYPHAAIQEIPHLVVNNNNAEAKSVLGRPIDGVGINSRVAANLSGADFDGDTALVIPLKGNGDIQYRPYFEELKTFEPKEQYRGWEGMKKMTKKQRGIEMGKVTNLITDMGNSGLDVPPQHLIWAIKHSMVVIDAYKHGLDYRQSEIDNHIDELKRIYQAHDDGTYGGASSLFSRAESDYYVPHRKYKGYDPETGEKIYEDTGRMSKKFKTHTVTATDPETGEKIKTQEFVRDENGKPVYKEQPAMIKSKMLAEYDDAFDLVSKGGGSLMEQIYARYSNSMKAFANEARVEAAHTKPMVQDPAAKVTYANEVVSILEQLKQAYMNKPLERQAQILANAEIELRKIENNDMTADELKKLKGRLLNEKRIEVGAKKHRIVLTEAEEKAINSGALSDTRLREVFKNMDPEYRAALFRPKRENKLTAAQVARAERLLDRGTPQGDVARELGVSVDTLLDSITPDEN